MNPFGVEHTPISKARGAKQGLKLISRNAKAGRKGMAARGELVREDGKWVDRSPEAIRRHVANSGHSGSKMGQGWKDRIKRAQTGDMD